MKKVKKHYAIKLGQMLVDFPEEEKDKEHYPDKRRLIPLRIWDETNQKEILTVHGDGMIVTENGSLMSPEASEAMIIWMQMNEEMTKFAHLVFGVLIEKTEHEVEEDTEKEASILEESLK